MHVVRVLQTAVVSEPCYVHNNSLLLCVRTCFNIYLGSESPANQSAAKAALSRMINSIMSRMEGQKETQIVHSEASSSERPSADEVATNDSRTGTETARSGAGTDTAKTEVSEESSRASSAAAAGGGAVDDKEGCRLVSRPVADAPSSSLCFCCESQEDCIKIPWIFRLSDCPCI